MWGFIDGCFTLVVLTTVLWRLRDRTMKSAKYRVTVAVVALMMFGFALVTSNYGTAFRHRGKFVPALIVLYSYGAPVRNRGSGIGSVREHPVGGCTRPMTGSYSNE